MLPRPGEVLHFSEDPTIVKFEPHVAATAQQPEAYVWACGSTHAPSYWFPRQCPRATLWAGADTSDHDRERFLGVSGADRIHAIEYDWLEAMDSTTVYAYRFDVDHFRPFGARAHAWVATEAVAPIGPPEAIGQLIDLHEEAGIELRLLADLWPFWDAVIKSTLEFSGIRLHNAQPRRCKGHCRGTGQATLPCT